MNTKYARVRTSEHAKLRRTGEKKCPHANKHRKADKCTGVIDYWRGDTALGRMRAIVRAETRGAGDEKQGKRKRGKGESVYERERDRVTKIGGGGGGAGGQNE